MCTPLHSYWFREFHLISSHFELFAKYVFNFELYANYILILNYLQMFIALI